MAMICIYNINDLEVSHLSSKTFTGVILNFADSTSATRLNDDDHYSIYNKLKGKAAKWRVIGKELGFKGEMDNIQSQSALFMRGSEGFLSEMLSQWLQWAPGDGRGSKGFATRESLDTAILKAIGNL